MKTLSKEEQLAMRNLGMEGCGKNFVMEDQSQKVQKQLVEEFNNQVDKYVDKFQKHQNELKKYANDLSKDLNGVEIMPMGSYVLAQPFEKNPFQKITTENGVITDLGGFTPEYKSHETGEIEEEQQYMKVATVIEVGPKCEFIQPGDIIIYTIASEVMIPFYKFGFVTVNEARVMAVVNEKLSDRKEKMRHGITE